MRYLLLAPLLLICLGCTTGTMNDTGDEYDDERIPDEQRLFQEIMDGYEIAVRPAATTSGVIVVRLGLRLNQIIDLDERHQTLTTKAFITQVWKDPSLAWDPSRFNNVRSLRIPSSKVWLPDTFIYNNADGGSTGFVTGQYVVLNYVGEVQWPVPVKLRSSCQVDVKYFPFDDQECILRFGSWIYNGDALSFDPLKEDAPVDLSEYVDNSEWDLLSVNLERSRRKESSCVDPHTDLVYRLHIRRRTFFYVFNVIIPCVMLSVLTLLTFWVPTTSGEKVTLGLSVFLAFSMFMLLIAEEVPASSESVPLIGIYLCCVMTMTSFSVIMAVLIINLYSRGVRTSRAPAWLRFICLRALSVILRVTHDIKTIAESITLDEEKVDLTKGKKHSPKKQESEGNERRDSNGRSFHRVEVHPRMFHRTSVDRRHGWLEYDTSRYPGDSSGEESDQEMYRPLPSTSNHEAMCDLLEAPEQDVDSKSPPSGTENKHSESEEMLEDTDNEVRESCQQAGYHDNNDNPCKEEDRSLLKEKEERRKATQKSLFEKKVEIAEWQRIALVIDRLLFWIFFWGTLTAYLIILVIIPGNKKIPFDDEVSTLHTMFHQS